MGELSSENVRCHLPSLGFFLECLELFEEIGLAQCYSSCLRLYPLVLRRPFLSVWLRLEVPTFSVYLLLNVLAGQTLYPGGGTFSRWSSLSETLGGFWSHKKNLLSLCCFLLLSFHFFQRRSWCLGFDFLSWCWPFLRVLGLLSLILLLTSFCIPTVDQSFFLTCFLTFPPMILCDFLQPGVVSFAAGLGPRGLSFPGRGFYFFFCGMILLYKMWMFRLWRCEFGGSSEFRSSQDVTRDDLNVLALDVVVGTVVMR